MCTIKLLQPQIILGGTGTTIQTLSSQAKAVVMQDMINEKFDCIFCQQNHVQTTGNISRNVMEIVQHRNVSTHTSSSPYYSRDNCQLRQTGSRGACIWLLTFHSLVSQGNLQKICLQMRLGMLVVIVCNSAQHTSVKHG